MDVGQLTRHPKLADQPKREKINRKSSRVTPTASAVRVALKGGHITKQEAFDLNPKYSEPPVKRVLNRITPTASSVRVALKGGHITKDEADSLNPKHSEPPVKRNRVKKKSPPKPVGEVTEEVRNGRTYKVTRLPDYTPAQLAAARKKANVRGTFRNRKEGKAAQ